jgi:hypothetical protein
VRRHVMPCRAAPDDCAAFTYKRRHLIPQLREQLLQMTRCAASKFAYAPACIRHGATHNSAGLAQLGMQSLTARMEMTAGFSAHIASAMDTMSDDRMNSQMPSSDTIRLARASSISGFMHHRVSAVSCRQAPQQCWHNTDGTTA